MCLNGYPYCWVAAGSGASQFSSGGTLLPTNGSPANYSIYQGLSPNYSLNLYEYNPGQGWTTLGGLAPGD